MGKRVLAMLLALALLLGTASLAETALPDGEYAPDGFSFSGGSGRVTITCPKLRVSGGEVLATLVFSSPNYPRLAVDGAGKRAAVQAYVGRNTLGDKPVCGKGTLRVFALKGPSSPVRKPIEEGRSYEGYGRRGKKKPAPQPWNW